MSFKHKFSTLDNILHKLSLKQCKHGNVRRNFIHVEHLCEEHATNTLDIISTPKISTHLFFCLYFCFLNYTIDQI